MTAEVDLKDARPDLQLDDVSKSFGSVVAVDRVGLSVQPGEFFSLLGPSGCGKTTTLRIVAGLELPDSGRVIVAGDDVTSVPPNRRKVNTVFQHYALFPHLTVEANVAYGLRHKGLGHSDMAARLQEGLKTVRLMELKDRYPRELSGGQQQRVALARALVNQPTILLLDEPLAALDLKLRKAMQQELKKLQERVAIAFLYVTHDQEEALTLSDRIVVMNEGRVLQEGTPAEIYERPRTRFVADFIGQTNLFEGTVEDVSPEATTVRTESGLLLRCMSENGVGPGTKVAVSLRPEKIGPADRIADAANTVEGTLTRRTYLGDLVQYHVTLAGGLEITMQAQNERSDPAARWDIGERVVVGWSRDSALVLEDDAPAIADESDLRLVEVEIPGRS